MIEYEAFGWLKQRVRQDGRIIGYVLCQTPTRWLAFSAQGAYLTWARTRREATAHLCDPQPASSQNG